MATLESEKLELKIWDILQYDSDGIKNMYEEFKILLKVDGEDAFTEGILRETHELCGNIPQLISLLRNVLSGVVREGTYETCEPDFEFQVKCLIDIEKDDLTKFLFPEHITQSVYEFIIWVSSGNWNGVYSDTSVGARFVVREDKLRLFLNELEQDYESRRIEEYN